MKFGIRLVFISQRVEIVVLIKVKEMISTYFHPNYWDPEGPQSFQHDIIKHEHLKLCLSFFRYS